MRTAEVATQFQQRQSSSVFAVGFGSRVLGEWLLEGGGCLIAGLACPIAAAIGCLRRLSDRSEGRKMRENHKIRVVRNSPCCVTGEDPNCGRSV